MTAPTNQTTASTEQRPSLFVRFMGGLVSVAILILAVLGLIALSTGRMPEVTRHFRSWLPQEWSQESWRCAAPTIGTVEGRQVYVAFGKWFDMKVPRPKPTSRICVGASLESGAPARWEEYTQ